MKSEGKAKNWSWWIALENQQGLLKAQQGVEVEVRRDLVSQRLNEEHACQLQALWSMCPWSEHMLQPSVWRYLAVGLIPISVAAVCFFFFSFPIYTPSKSQHFALMMYLSEWSWSEMSQSLLLCSSCQVGLSGISVPWLCPWFSLEGMLYFIGIKNNIQDDCSWWGWGDESFGLSETYGGSDITAKVGGWESHNNWSDAWTHFPLVKADSNFILKKKG